MATKKKSKARAAKAATRKSPRKKAARVKATRSAVASRRKLVPGVRDRRSKEHPESLRLRSASVGFTVGDIEKSLKFYTEALNFTAKSRWERDGKLAGVELVAGTVSVYLGQDDWQKGRDRVKGQGTRVYFETVQDIDALAARIKAWGWPLQQEPTDQPSWGMRDFGLADPDGFNLTFLAPIAKK